MKYPYYLVFILILTTACNSVKSDEGAVESEMTDPPSAEGAVVLAVTATAEPGAYTFDVQLKSPDTGCDQYADWWEVIGTDGRLKYRRILTHSHVTEQPFTRSGGPVPINADETVYVRGHMNKLGYGSKIFRGSVNGGFQADTLAAIFADTLAVMEPLPVDCAF